MKEHKRRSGSTLIRDDSLVIEESPRLESTERIKVADPLYVYAILDPASSPTTLTQVSGPLSQTMAQASFYRADKPLKNSAANAAATQVALASPMRQA
jgi:hypothetical protein